MNGGVDLRILGIDPGYAIVGFGVLEYNSGKFTVVDYGAITTSSDMDFNTVAFSSCRENSRVGLLLFGYSYTMYCIEYYPCGGAV